MDLRRYAAIAWRWSWLLLLGAALAGLTAFLVSRAQTPIYQATGTLLVNDAQDVTRPTFSDIQANQQLTKTYSEIATSGPVLDRVSQETGLSYEQLGERVSASPRRDTQLIDITVRDPDRERAASLANTVAETFAQQIRETQTGQQSAIEQDLERQAQALRTWIEERRLAAAQLGAPRPGLPEEQRAQQLNAALSQLETLNQKLATVDGNIQDLRIERVKGASSVTLIDPARPPDAPVSPRVLLNTVVGVILGLIVAAGIVALREYLDDTVKSADDVSRVAGIATLGTIGRFGGSGRRSGGLAEGHGVAEGPVGADGFSPISEAYRMVRTNLEFARGGRAGRSTLITSALPGEGKSTTAANLASVLAQTGRRVILVDTDLRRPSLHGIFKLPNTSGLSTLFVMERPDLGGLLRPTRIESLRVLPSGPLPPNPAELLASERMGEIIALLEAESDVVLFDSPPLLSVADGATLAARLDGVVLVVEAGRTRSGLVARAAEILNQARASIWGVVLNRSTTQTGEGYYYYAAEDRTRSGGATRTNGVRAAASVETNGYHAGSGGPPDSPAEPAPPRPRTRSILRDAREPRRNGSD